MDFPRNQSKWLLYLVFYTLLNLGSFFSCAERSDFSAKLLLPNSIYPCLDHLEVLVKRRNLPHSDYLQLVRVYSSESQKNRQFQDYQYLFEFNLPHEDILKIKCNLFSPTEKFYCFNYIAFHRYNRSIKLWTELECRATLLEYSEPTISTGSTLDVNFLNTTPSFYGPSYKLATKLQEQDAVTELENSDDPSPKIIDCDCNHILLDPDRDVNTILVKVSSCSDKETAKCSNRSQLFGRFEDQSLKRTLFCTINFTIPSLLVRVQITKKSFCDANGLTDDGYSRHASSSSLNLVMRNGPLSISPQLQLDMSSIEHRLDPTSIIRIESPTGYFYEVYIARVFEANQSTSFHSILISGSLLSQAIFVLSALIVFNFLLLVSMHLLCRRSPKTVQIMILEDGPETCTSIVDVSSLGQFSFAESGSLEMDYYDYEVHRQEIIESLCHAKNQRSIQCEVILEQTEEENKEDSYDNP